MQVIALCNQKGGVGKTTTAYHLARAAHRGGRRTLAIDLDPQANLTASLAAEDVAPDALSVADVLSPRAGESLAAVAVPTLWEGVDLIPSVTQPLAAVAQELVGVPVGRESRLRAALAAYDGDHDLVLIDCPPELGQLTINALAAADRAAVVTATRFFAMQGTASVLDSIDTIRSHYNPALVLAGLIVNAHEAHTVTGRTRLQEMHDAGLPVLEPVIPKRAPINDALEAAIALDQWPDDGPRLAQLYTTLLTNLEETTR